MDLEFTRWISAPTKQWHRTWIQESRDVSVPINSCMIHVCAPLSDRSRASLKANSALKTTSFLIYSIERCSVYRLPVRFLFSFLCSFICSDFTLFSEQQYTASVNKHIVLEYNAKTFHF